MSVRCRRRIVEIRSRRHFGRTSAFHSYCEVRGESSTTTRTSAFDRHPSPVDRESSAPDARLPRRTTSDSDALHGPGEKKGASRMGMEARTTAGTQAEKGDESRRPRRIVSVLGLSTNSLPGPADAAQCVAFLASRSQPDRAPRPDPAPTAPRPDRTPTRACRRPILPPLRCAVPVAGALRTQRSTPADHHRPTKVRTARHDLRVTPQLVHLSPRSS